MNMTTQRGTQATATTAAEAKELLIDALVLDPRLQFRVEMNPQQVERLAGAYDTGAKIPPIEVALVDGVPMVTDGWHRVAALKQLRWRTVAALVTPMSKDEAHFAASLANLQHGLNLKPSEMKKAQRTALALYLRMKRHLPAKGKAKSFREIGMDLGGMDHTTVRRWIIKYHPRIAQNHWNLGTTPGAGGPQASVPKLDLGQTAAESMRNALAAFQGVTNAAEQAALIVQAWELVERMEEGKEWRIEAVPADDFF